MLVASFLAAFFARHHPEHADVGSTALQGPRRDLPFEASRLYSRHTPRLWRLNYVSCICSRADGATAGSQSPSQVRNKCHVISHVASGCDPTGCTSYVGTLMPRSRAETRSGLDFSEVRTCKVPPTHQCAVCR